MAATTSAAVTGSQPKALPVVKRQLVVFDFDWSLADQDTDRWVHECLAPELRRKQKALKGTMDGMDLFAGLLVDLHAKGVTPEQIKDSMRKMPFHPAMVRGVKDLKADKQTETVFFLLSNSNTVYIDTILDHQGLQPPHTEIFSEIVTNPAEFEPSGLLRLRRRLDPSGPQHNCKVGCGPNMCKGEELDAFLARHGGRESFERVVYVGDGGNDYCPVTRLGERDLAFVRRFRGLEKRIAKEGNVTATVWHWAGAWEVEGLLGHLRGV
ncbi:hypothetical protein CF327_g1672 [Tilletia walkeri]|uniref:Uncharacterized protein n=1 Tax=Tilletia walkeri TaxID=117179 RepID=A0A8X7N7V8_9BASI|nr:hypothetical protein CF327_g1672 [Tilletia walkeri]KAE8267246.1 hypothetical protein A4X09_0g5097 [Tilletia walkeri]